MDFIKNKFLNLSVGSKLTVLVMFITSFSIISACSLFIVYENYSAKKAMVQDLTLLVDVIGKRTAPGLQFVTSVNNEKAKSNLADLKNESGVVLACIYKAEGALIAGFIPKKGEICKLSSQIQESFQFTKGYLAIYRNIYSISGKIVGLIYIKSDMSELKNHLIRVLSFISLLMFGLLIIAFLLTRLLQKLIVDPILCLTTAATSIKGEHNYNQKVEVYYKDEIGILANAFNDMLSKIRHRDAALKDANKNLEQKVQERTKDLKGEKERAEEASEAKSEFLRNMSHEFRTPLHAMLSFATFGLQEYEAADRNDLKGYFERIIRVTNRLTGLVDGVLNIARMESGAEQFLFDIHDLNLIISATEQEQLALAGQKQCTLKWAPLDHSVDVVCDKSKIVQVITNFLGNAIKFSEPGQVITINIQETEDEVMISVADQGLGIPGGEEEDIFGKFVQSSRTKTEAGGTGLGLSICNGIIKGHNGRTWAENNKESSGAIFYFVVPKNIKPGVRVIKIDSL